MAAMPGENASALLTRWQHWFGGMNVPPSGLRLLEKAQAAGVGDIPALQKWLKQAERQGQGTATATLTLALKQLMADRTLRQWLEWPVNRFDILPAGALFFACQATSWARKHLLHAVVLAAMQLSGIRLVAHGLPGTVLTAPLIRNLPSIMVSNGPRLPASTIVLTACHPRGQAMLQKRFLAGNARLGETLALLQSGESLVLANGTPVWSTW